MVEVGELLPAPAPLSRAQPSHWAGRWALLNTPETDACVRVRVTVAVLLSKHNALAFLNGGVGDGDAFTRSCSLFGNAAHSPS